MPITTAGDRDRRSPFGEIGERGVFVKELEEALLDGRIDAAVHSAKDMTSTDTAGLAVGAYLPREDRPRRAVRRRRRSGRACGSARRPCAGGRSCSRSSRRSRSSRCAGTSTRGCASAASAGSTRSCSPPAGSTGSVSRPRSACRFDPAEMLPEAGQGALALQVRAGEEELVAAADDAETRRRVEAERTCVAAVGGGCLAPVAAHHDGTTLVGLVADEDGRWVERRSGDDPVALGEELARLAVVLTRPEGRNEELAAQLRELGHEVGDRAADRDRAGRDRAGRPRRLRLARPDERRPARASSKRRVTGRAARVAAIGRATADAWGEVDLVPAVVDPGGAARRAARGPPAGCSSPARRARGRCSRRSSSADVVVLYRTRALAPEDRRRPRRGRVAVGRARARGDQPAIPVVSIGPETTSAAPGGGPDVCSREAETPDVAGLVSAPSQG